MTPQRNGTSVPIDPEACPRGISLQSATGCSGRPAWTARRLFSARRVAASLSVCLRAVLLPGATACSFDSSTVTDSSTLPVQQLAAGRVLTPNPQETIPVYTLTARRVIGDSLTFSEILAIRILSTNIVVLDRLNDPHVSVFNRQDGLLRARFGRHGQGPGELVEPAWAVPNESADDAIWLFDFRTRRFLRYAASPSRTLKSPKKSRSALRSRQPLCFGAVSR